MSISESNQSAPIARHDIISEDALNWSDEYSKKIKKAIKLNNQFLKSLKQIRKELSKSA
ncbi:hypothetical protein K5I29_04030 [Flavobacterium agricola]|uniref:Uncharacterized protein n=1 Tax=Flavobacterium agricola TaxID=2870839 RepID=A0ABY6M0J4_9FLAO|nr:hypothetical protein [Flavobacterium agricola]UYW02077.1 hypothetical protein K5I29_04030 [Flavobacterium agricola]